MAIYQYAMGFDIFTSLPNFENTAFDIIENENGEQELGEGTLMAEGTVSSPLAIIYNYKLECSFNISSCDINNDFSFVFKATNDISSRINSKFIYGEKVYKKTPYLNKLLFGERIPYSLSHLKTSQLKIESKLTANITEQKIAKYTSDKDAIINNTKKLGHFPNERYSVKSNFYYFNYDGLKSAVLNDNYYLHNQDEKRIQFIKNEELKMLPSVLKYGNIYSEEYLYHQPTKFFNLFDSNEILSVQPIRQGLISDNNLTSHRNDLIGLSSENVYLSDLNRPLSSIVIDNLHQSERPLLEGLNRDEYKIGKREEIEGLVFKQEEYLGVRYDLEGIKETVFNLAKQDLRIGYNFENKMLLSSLIDKFFVVLKLKNPAYKNDAQGYFYKEIDNYQVQKEILKVQDLSLHKIGSYTPTEIDKLDTNYYLDKIIKGFVPINQYYLNKREKEVRVSEVVSIQFEFKKERDFNEVLQAWNQDKAGKYDYLSVPAQDFSYQGFSLNSNGVPYYILPGQDLGKPSVKVLYPKDNFYPEAKDIGIDNVQISLEAFYEVILTLHAIYKKDFYKLAGMYSDEALIYVLELLKGYLETENKWNSEYKRIFRFCRWYAESTLVAYSTFILRRKFISYEVRNYIDIPEELSEEIVIPAFLELAGLEDVAKDYMIKYELIIPKLNALKYLDLHLFIFKDGEYIGKVSYTEKREETRYDTEYYFYIDEDNYAYYQREENDEEEIQTIYINNMYKYQFFVGITNNGGYQPRDDKPVNLNIYKDNLKIKEYTYTKDNLIQEDFETQKIDIISYLFIKYIDLKLYDISEIIDFTDYDQLKGICNSKEESMLINKDEFIYLNNFTTAGEFQNILHLTGVNLTDVQTYNFIFVKENFIDGYFSLSWIIQKAQEVGGRINIYIDKKLVSSSSTSGTIKEEIFFVDRGIHLYRIEYIGNANVNIYNIGITGVIYESSITECVDDNAFFGIRKVEMLLDKIFKYYQDHHLNKIKGAESLMQRKLWI